MTTLHPSVSTPTPPNDVGNGEPYRGIPGLRITRGRWLHGWRPEDETQWSQGGRRLANTNLAVSVFAEFLGFALWAIWSIVVPQLPAAGFDLTVNELFWLVSVPSLVGATLRIPYTFAVPRFGGRNWTIVSTLLLLVPALGLAWAVNHPELPFGALLVIAALAGFGGGNFASSMANISFFFPEANKGAALGLNAAGGNLGTAAVQFAVPLIIVAGAGIALDRAGLIFVPLALVAACLAWRLMHNVTDATSDGRSFVGALRHKHTWFLSVIYIGTFGSFIGYSVSFPTLLATQFPQVTVPIAFLGALVGSLSRPFGGILADKFGGSSITIASLVAMMLGAGGVILGLHHQAFGLFFSSFCWLFLCSGVGNGAVYRMIPAVFRITAANSEAGLLDAKRLAASCLGIAGAIGAFGGFLVPRGFALSTLSTGSIVPALVVAVGGYAALALLTWTRYGRRTTALGGEKI